MLPTEWHFLERLHDCLDDYYWCTKEAEKHSAHAGEYFPTLQYMLDEVHHWQQEAEAEGSNMLALSLLASWNKIEKYYKLVDQTPVYYAAVILNPTLKMLWFRKQWQTDETLPWIAQVEDLVRTIWRREYKATDNAAPPPSSRTTALQSKETAYDRFKAFKRLRFDPSDAAAAPQLLDQFEQYLASDPVLYDSTNKRDFDVIGYWKERELLQPQLAQFAFDVFSLPVMTADNERSFSSGRDMITYRRSRLLSDIIEACQCLKSWLTPPKKKDIDDDEGSDEEEVEEL